MDEELKPRATEEELDELRRKHGTILEVESESGYYVVLAKPAKQTIGAVYSRFMSQIGVPQQRATALAGLFKSCVVFPDKDAIAKMLADEPGLGAVFGGECGELIGIRETTVKKS
jgi:hypothetical protein